MCFDCDGGLWLLTLVAWILAGIGFWLAVGAVSAVVATALIGPRVRTGVVESMKLALAWELLSASLLVLLHVADPPFGSVVIAAGFAGAILSAVLARREEIAPAAPTNDTSG